MSETIKNHPFITDLEPRFASLIESLAKRQEYVAGTQIFREGDRAHHLYLITEGSVAIQAYSPGKGCKTIDSAGSGEFVGWAWLVPPYKAHYDALAQTDVECYQIDAETLLEMCEQDHELGYRIYSRMIQLMEQRLQSTRLLLLDLYGKGVR